MHDKSEFAKKEEEILKFWEKNKIFEKSLEARKGAKIFVFYEGPPYANGRPGIHHAESRVFKDIILRYKTMQGFYVPRRAGWDTHGLPTEMEVEKILGIKSKKEIEEKIGIEKFVEECRKNVFLYKEEWEKFTERIGYWLDLENAYVTMENYYIETLWWIIKEISKKGLLYEDYKVLPWCPRCQTALSSHEVAQGYKRITEDSITVKFELIDEIGTYILAWTTTPWTLPGNVALAVNLDIDYIKFSLKNYPGISDGIYITSKEDFDPYQNKAGVEIIEEIKGRDLIGKKYKPLYPNEAPYVIIGGDFVTIKEGTGVVHIAPAFGEDDLKVGKEKNLPILTTVNEEGKMLTRDYPWNGIFIKDADRLIIEDLKKRNLLFHTELYEHDYPFCWRCDSPLMYYAKNSWFLKTTAVKEKMIKENSKINWIPSYLREGRFGEWLKDLRDWAISRERYWGAPLPIWKCEKCKEIKVVGSIDELGIKDEIDLHRPYIDKIILKCDKCNAKMSRVPEVMDVWFDSGSMPFAQLHYPFESQDLIDTRKFYPADYICEAIDQTRGWFYTLLAVSSLLGFESSYKNVISLGLVLDEKGQKMSKSKGNIVEPMDLMEKYGADAVRWYFYTINQPWDEKLFSEKDVTQTLRRFLMIFWNSIVYFKTYNVNQNTEYKIQNTRLIINKWVIIRLNQFSQDVADLLDKYDIVSASRKIEEFVIEDISRWYIRQIRNYMKKPDSKEAKESISILGFILLEISKIAAPFVPFIAERTYKELNREKESVHLEEFPSGRKLNEEDKKIIENMETARKIVSIALEERSKQGIKVRQVLSSFATTYNISDDFLPIIQNEINVKRIKTGQKENKLDLDITEELKKEGIIRELLRNIQDLRKKSGLIPQDKIGLIIETGKNGEKLINKFEKEIKKGTNTNTIEFSPNDGGEVEFDELKFKIEIKK
ncbi:MAG: isoleucine--tRNA ligase [Patescibacteria group bacterium]